MDMNEKGVLFYYLRKENPKDKTAKRGIPYGVVAIRMNEDNTVNRGMAVCSSRDTFDKEYGRKLAFSRLRAAEYRGDHLKLSGIGCYFGRNQQCPVDKAPFAYIGMFRARAKEHELRMFINPGKNKEE